MVLVGNLRISPKFYERIARTHARNTFFFFFFPFFLPFSKKNLSVFFPFLPIVISIFLSPVFLISPKKNKNRFLPLERKREKWYTMSYNLGPTEQTAANKKTEKEK